MSSSTSAPDRVPGDKLEAELLANERTFLAWVRTSIAVMTLGFVVARFGLWLRELAAKINSQAQQASTGISLPLGATMIAFGACLTIFAAWRYHVVNRAIEHGQIKADPRLVWIISIAISVLAIVIILYMVFAAAKA
jgi:putative membrane protein